MIDFEYKANYSFDDLVGIMDILREHCPWDKEQTHQSIRRSMLEEAYEACDAIDSGDMPSLKEELGDVLLQVVFHAVMEKERGVFDIDDVCDGVCKKLIFRHPHIFSDGDAKTSNEVLDRWDELKRVEKGQQTHSSALDAVARSLPALWRAEKLYSKAKKAGVDYLEATAADGGEDRYDERSLGDELFRLSAVAKKLDIDPETALAGACDRFVDKFKVLEKNAAGGAMPPVDEQRRVFAEE